MINAFRIIAIGAAAALLLSKKKNKEKKIQDNNWKQRTNIYEVNIRQYTTEGTFQAFRAHLPRLKHLGVEILWLMPVTPIAEKERKGGLGSAYAARDYCSVNPEFGSLEDFRELVADAHSQGFKVIIDWVANHTGWDHSWTVSNPEFYKKDPETGDFQTASGMADIIELDYANDKMRLAMTEAMQFWIHECKIDGFRCDLAAWVTLDFWKQAQRAIDPDKNLFWLGEYDELDNPGYGDVFDASYSWNWMHRTREFHDGALSLAELKNLLVRYSQLGDSSMRAWFTSNHDENTWNGTEYEKYGPFALPLAVFSATWNGVPLMYSGQEIPLVNHRLQFFERDTIQWPVECKLHGFYRNLFLLKARNPALHGGNPDAGTEFLTTSREDSILAYSRKSGTSEVRVFLNMGWETVTFQIADTDAGTEYLDVFSGEKGTFGPLHELTLEKGGFLVLEKTESADR